MTNNLLLTETSARWVDDIEITDDLLLIKEIKKGFPVKFYAHKNVKLLELRKSNESLQHISLLKSNLQKAVRLGLVDCAVMTSLALIEADPIQLIRRLPIISLEDKYGGYPELHDHLATLLFMMSTEKGIPGYPQFLANFVTTICQQGYLPVGHQSTLPSLQVKESHIKNLKLRQAFGGMKGDMEMINWIIEQQQTRPYTSSPPLKFWDSRTKKGLILRILNQAVDFHNCPKILEVLGSKFPNITQSQIRSAIWLHSSSIRNDTEESTSLLDVWSIIKTEVGLFQSRYIQRLGYVNYYQ